MNIQERYQPRRVSVSFEGVKSVTQHAHRDQTNINEIIKRYDRTGVLPGPDDNPGQYMDCTELSQRNLTELIEEARATKEKWTRLEGEMQEWQAALDEKSSEPPPSVMPKEQEQQQTE